MWDVPDERARHLRRGQRLQEKNCLGVLRGIFREAKTLDDAMAIKAVLEKIVKTESAGDGPLAPRRPEQDELVR